MNRAYQYLISIVLSLICVVPGVADEWEYYIPLKGIEDVIYMDGEIFCATGSGLFILDDEDFTYRRVTRIEGFPASAANALVQESENTILVATEIPGDTLQGSGVYRYNLDSGEWVILNHPDYFEFDIPYVMNMERDGDGNVWGIGEGELFRVIEDNLVKQTPENGLFNDISYAISLAIDANGDVLMSYNKEEGSGIARRIDDTWITVLERPGYAVGNLTIAADNTIWFSQSDSVFSYDGSTILSYDFGRVSSGIGGKRITATDNNTVWCASHEQLVRIYGGETEDMTTGFLEALEPAIAPHPFRSFKSVYTNGDDPLVIAYCGVGNEWYEVPGKYSNGGWKFFVPGDDLKYPYRVGRPSDIAVDTKGTLWMAGFFTMFGLNTISFNGIEWTIYGMNMVYDIAIDEKNRTWLFGWNVWYYDNGEWTTFSQEDYPIFSDVMRAGTATSSRAWMGDGKGNVYVYEFGGDWTKYDAADVGTGYITSVAADDRWGVWVTGTSGTAYFDGEEWTLYTDDNSGLPNKHVEYAAFGRSGTVWFATGSGLVSFDGTTWEVFTTLNSGITDDRVNSVMTARNGDLWISTRGGFCRYDGETWKAFTKENTPLPSGRIRETAESPDGSIWIADGMGLCRYIPENVTGITEYNGLQPSSHVITGVYPNPFNNSVTVEYVLPARDTVSFEVYNLAGQRAYHRIIDMVGPGVHRVMWDGHTTDGGRAAAGLYILRIHAGGLMAAAKAVYLK